jgi:hypothetical protein
MAIQYIETEFTSTRNVLADVVDADTQEAVIRTPVWLTPRQQTSMALWLVECGAVLTHETLPDPQTTTWTLPEWALADARLVNLALDSDPEYHAWVDDRWAEIQDHQALTDDALENW